MTVFSDNIKSLRKKNKMSQAELAERLYLTPQAISKWECGLSEPELGFLCELAKVFCVTTDELLGISDKPSDELMIGIDGGGTKTEFVLIVTLLTHHISHLKFKSLQQPQFVVRMALSSM